MPPLGAPPQMNGHTAKMRDEARITLPGVIRSVGAPRCVAVVAHRRPVERPLRSPDASEAHSGNCAQALLAVVRAVFVVGLVCLLLAADRGDPGLGHPPVPTEVGWPVRAAFYYPWFPESEHWATRYTPSLGKYDSSDPARARHPRGPGSVRRSGRLHLPRTGARAVPTARRLPATFGRRRSARVPYRCLLRA